jgi:hypothetical protein
VFFRKSITRTQVSLTKCEVICAFLDGSIFGQNPMLGSGAAQAMSHVVDTLRPLPEHWHGHFSITTGKVTMGVTTKAGVPDEQKTLMSKVAKS